MRLLQVIVFFLIFLGLFNILITVFKIPKYNNEFINLFKTKKNKLKENQYTHTTYEIAKRIKLPIFIKNRLNEKLKIADINSTPELYISNLINKSFTYLFCAILFIYIEKTLSFVFVFLGFNTIVKGYKNIDDVIKVKTEKVEKEIPKFLDFMTNSFAFNKNVKQAFESYEKIAGENFKNNIKITIADMTTGNYERALRRLDKRVNSYSFSKVIRAIIQVVKGDENTQYLRNLYRECSNSEYERLKKEANKKLDKVSFYSKIMLVCIMVIIFTMVGFMLIKNISKVGGLY